MIVCRNFLFFLALFALTAAFAEAKRIVAVGGTVAETLVLLGAEKHLVATDTTAQYPESIAKLPKVGYQRTLSLEGILSMRPDLVLASVEAGPPGVLERLEKMGIRVVRLPDNHDADSAAAMLAAIGAAIGVNGEVADFIKDFCSQLKMLTAKTPDSKPKALFLLSMQNRLAAGRETKADAMFNLIGLENVFADVKGYKPLSPEALAQLQPEWLIIMGGPSAPPAWQNDVALKNTPAGRSGQVLVVDGMFFLGFGPRLPEAVAWARAAIFK
jgi:iron complex transport system substrate-binding protein